MLAMARRSTLSVRPFWPDATCEILQPFSSICPLAPLATRSTAPCGTTRQNAQGLRAAALAGLHRLDAVTTAYTISLDDPATMAAKAVQAARAMPLLKIKLGGAGDEERMRAIRAACPGARLIGDANEAWTPATLPGLMAVAAETGFELIEQPLPAGEDAPSGSDAQDRSRVCR